MPGKVPELDDIAKELQQAMNDALPNMAALDTYQKAKKYDDKGTAGLLMQKQLVADLEKVDALFERFDHRLDVHQKASHAKKLADLKANGDLPMLNA